MKKDRRPPARRRRRRHRGCQGSGALCRAQLSRNSGGPGVIELTYTERTRTYLANESWTSTLSSVKYHLESLVILILRTVQFMFSMKFVWRRLLCNIQQHSWPTVLESTMSKSTLFGRFSNVLVPASRDCLKWLEQSSRNHSFQIYFINEFRGGSETGLYFWHRWHILGQLTV